VATQLRSKKSTAANAVLTYRAAASTPLEPPIELSEPERVHFDRITESRERDSWSGHDLALAAQLAQTQARYQEAMADVAANGVTLLTEKGHPALNPAVSGLSSLGSAIARLTSLLGLGASQRGLSTDGQRGRNKAEKTARDVLRKAAHCDLLA
jgi:P27 family predicted phage terminase small subunit